MSAEGKQGDLTVGVIGGLGPEATLDFFTKVLAHTPAESDQDHLRLLIDNNPKVPNRHAAIRGTGESPAPMLAESARKLAQAGADFLAMPCNTAHAFEPDIRAATTLPFVSIIEEGCEALMRRRPGARQVGVLAAEGCLEAGLYQAALSGRGLAAVTPDAEELRALMDLVYAIKSGNKGEETRAGVRGLAEALIGRGAEAVIAGCTEVPLVLGEGDLNCPLIDSTDVLAERCVRYAKRELPLPGSVILANDKT
jgi:aspartate racemase